MLWSASDFFSVFVKSDPRYLRAIADGFDVLAEYAAPEVLKFVVKAAGKSNVEC